MLNWDISVTHWDRTILPAIETFIARYCEKLPGAEYPDYVEPEHIVQSMAGYLNDYDRSTARPFCMVVLVPATGMYHLMMPSTREVWVCNCSRGDLFRFIQNLDKDIGKLR